MKRINNEEDKNNKGSVNVRGSKNKFVTALVLFICIISALSGRQILDNGTENNSGYESNENSKSSENIQGESSNNEILYQFRNDKYLTEHFEKHGSDFDYATKEEYLAGANKVISSDNVLHKIEKEDGDDVYYLEETNEFVIVSTDGYIRTYFKPANGIAYYNRQ